MQNMTLFLRWNDHHPALLRTVSSIREQKLYSDATIMCEGRFFPVHKITLASCSSYFELLFNQLENEKHPVIVLTDIKAVHVEALLLYMYQGEVIISEKSLAGLLRAADSLEVRGLSKGSDENTEVREASRELETRPTLEVVPCSTPGTDDHPARETEMLVDGAGQQTLDGPKHVELVQQFPTPAAAPPPPPTSVDKERSIVHQLREIRIAPKPPVRHAGPSYHQLTSADSQAVHKAVTPEQHGGGELGHSSPSRNTFGMSEVKSSPSKVVFQNMMEDIVVKTEELYDGDCVHKGEDINGSATCYHYRDTDMSQEETGVVEDDPDSTRREVYFRDFGTDTDNAEASEDLSDDEERYSDHYEHTLPGITDGPQSKPHNYFNSNTDSVNNTVHGERNAEFTDLHPFVQLRSINILSPSNSLIPARAGGQLTDSYVMDPSLVPPNHTECDVDNPTAASSSENPSRVLHAQIPKPASAGQTKAGKSAEVPENKFGKTCNLEGDDSKTTVPGEGMNDEERCVLRSYRVSKCKRKTRSRSKVHGITSEQGSEAAVLSSRSKSTCHIRSTKVVTAKTSENGKTLHTSDSDRHLEESNAGDRASPRGVNVENVGLQFVNNSSIKLVDQDDSCRTGESMTVSHPSSGNNEKNSQTVCSCHICMPTVGVKKMDLQCSDKCLVQQKGRVKKSTFISKKNTPEGKSLVKQKGKVKKTTCTPKKNKPEGSVLAGKTRLANPRKSCSYTAKQKAHVVEHMRVHTGGRLPHKQVVEEELNLSQNLVSPCRQFEELDSGDAGCSVRIDTRIAPNQLNTESAKNTPLKCKADEIKKEGSGAAPGTPKTSVPLQQKQFACSSECCPYTTNVRSHMIEHMRTHTGERPFPCSYCTYKSRTKSSLTQHMLRRHNNRVAKNKILSGKKSCRKTTHLTSDKVKIYSCKACSYRTRDLIYLKKHKMVHSQGKIQHSCSQCSYRTHRALQLKLHELSHEGKTTFTCKYCPHLCLTKFGINRHMLGHTKFACQFCPFKSVHKYSMIRHERNIHPKVAQ